MNNQYYLYSALIHISILYIGLISNYIEKPISPQKPIEIEYLDQVLQKNNTISTRQFKSKSLDITRHKKDLFSLSNPIKQGNNYIKQGTNTQQSNNSQSNQQGKWGNNPDLLHAKELVYNSFLARVRDKIEQEWRPRIREALKNINAKLQLPIETFFKLIIDSSGRLVRASLIIKSLYEKLDQVAKNTLDSLINSIGITFPNPPKELFNGKSEFELNFSFEIY